MILGLKTNKVLRRKKCGDGGWYLIDTISIYKGGTFRIAFMYNVNSDHVQCVYLPWNKALYHNPVTTEFGLRKAKRLEGCKYEIKVHPQYLLKFLEHHTAQIVPI